MSVTEPDINCQLCPRLAAFRAENKTKFPEFFNAPVPAWGDENAKLAIVGLAPGLKGANRTGRPFTGDYAGDLLYETLGKAGMAAGKYEADPNDNLTLYGVKIVNAVRCVPPQNKPIGAEIKTCRQFLSGVLDKTDARIYLALGRIAHESLLSSLGARRAAHPFAHGARHEISTGEIVYDSYHCSRYNTNTRRLTTEMFEDVVFRAAEEAKAEGAATA